MKKALVVDDNEGIRQLLKEVLVGEGYTVDTASNGIDALEKIQECLPSVVLLDSKMPVMGGMEVVNVIANSYPELPVILISAYLNDVQKSLKSGLIKYSLSKPFSLTDLTEILHSLNI